MDEKWKIWKNNQYTLLTEQGNILEKS